jgi:molecular chaperone GrpE
MIYAEGIMESKSKQGRQIKVEAEPGEEGAAQEPETADAGTEAGSNEISAEELEQLRAAAAKAEEYRNRMLREAADFENFKKRAAREKQDSITYANESLLQKLVPVLDTFEMALAASGSDNPATESIQKGVAMVYNQLKSTLAEAGLEEIDARGKTFDPNLHEAVSQQETADVAEGGVTQQIRKGYKFRNRLVRPAGVVVAKKPAS